MNEFQRLKRDLVKMGIRHDAFCIPGQYPSNETYVISSLAMNQFSVYYYEKGMRQNEEIYDCIDSAIIDITNRIKNDKSTYK